MEPAFSVSRAVAIGVLVALGCLVAAGAFLGLGWLLIKAEGMATAAARERQEYAEAHPSGPMLDAKNCRDAGGLPIFSSVTGYVTECKPLPKETK